MAKVNYTRINLFNSLVCPDEIDNGEWTFDDWCDERKSNETYLQKRSYLLLDVYSAFRKIYNFFFCHKEDDEDTHIRKFYCSFSPDGKEMVITVKYKKPRDIDPSFFDALGRYFDIDPGDTYDDFDIEPPCEEHNSLKLIFYKKG
jgi:hypothetical protein